MSIERRVPILKRRAQIIMDLKRNPSDPRYTFYTPSKSSSHVWRNFQAIKFRDKVENFAQCNNCRKILNYSLHTGTGGLIKHQCIVDSRIDERILMKSQEAQLYYVTKDLIPFAATDGDGFKALCQHLIRFGAGHGMRNIDELLATPNDLQLEIMPAVYIAIKDQLSLTFESNQLAFAIDVWSQNAPEHRELITVSAHYVDDNYTFKSNVLGTMELIPGATRTHSIYDSTQQILADWEMLDKIDSSVIVANDDEEVLAAFAKPNRLPCACHILNNVMHEVLVCKNNSRLEALLVATKKLVELVEQSSIREELTRCMLGYSGRSDWSALFTQLSTVRKMRLDIEFLASHDNRAQVAVVAIDFELLTELCEFLAPFVNFSERIGMTNVSTLQDYAVWYQKMLKHCGEVPDDSRGIAKLKFTMRKMLFKKFRPLALHHIALFLNPYYKSLMFLPHTDRAQLIDKVKNMLRQMVDPLSVNIDGTLAAGATRPKDEADIEIETYLKDTRVCINVLEYWRSANDTPLMRDLSRQILNVPASCVLSEKLFSIADRSLVERRSQLVGNDIDTLLFLNKNFTYTEC